MTECNQRIGCRGRLRRLNRFCGFENRFGGSADRFSICNRCCAARNVILCARIEAFETGEVAELRNRRVLDWRKRGDVRIGIAQENRVDQRVQLFNRFFIRFFGAARFGLCCVQIFGKARECDGFILIINGVHVFASAARVENALSQRADVRFGIKVTGFSGCTRILGGFYDGVCRVKRVACALIGAVERFFGILNRELQAGSGVRVFICPGVKTGKGRILAIGDRSENAGQRDCKTENQNHRAGDSRLRALHALTS